MRRSLDLVPQATQSGKQHGLLGAAAAGGSARAVPALSQTQTHAHLRFAPLATLMALALAQSFPALRPGQCRERVAALLRGELRDVHVSGLVLHAPPDAQDCAVLRLLRRATRLSITINPAAMQPSMACIACLMPRLCSLSITLTESATSPATSAAATAFHETLASTCGEATSSDGEDMAAAISCSAVPGQLSQLHSFALHVPVGCLFGRDTSGAQQVQPPQSPGCSQRYHVPGSSSIMSGHLCLFMLSLHYARHCASGHTSHTLLMPPCTTGARPAGKRGPALLRQTAAPAPDGSAAAHALAHAAVACGSQHTARREPPACLYAEQEL